tara:strand:+ start:217 stop:645 length:429 start_codon:yes stop_codon:yes gene_type:complete
MTLKELQSMIKEEFDAFQNEAEDEVDVSVDTDAGDIDAMAPEGEGEEDVLRKIYDLLALHFDGGEEEEEMDMGDEMPAMDDAEGEAAPDSELDEWTGKNDPKPGGKGSTGYDQKVGGKGSTGYDAGSKALQERFQKLANIIK